MNSLVGTTHLSLDEASGQGTVNQNRKHSPVGKIQLEFHFQSRKHCDTPNQCFLVEWHACPRHRHVTWHSHVQQYHWQIQKCEVCEEAPHRTEGCLIRCCRHIILPFTVPLVQPNVCGSVEADTVVHERLIRCSIVALVAKLLLFPFGLVTG